MCGFRNAYEGTWRHVAYAHVNHYYVPYRCICKTAFKSLGDVNRHMRRTNCELVYAPEETLVDQTKVAFKTLMRRVRDHQDSALEPKSFADGVYKDQHSDSEPKGLPTTLVEPMTDDELDYEDAAPFTPCPELQPGLTPLSELDLQMG